MAARDPLVRRLIGSEGRNGYLAGLTDEERRALTTRATAASLAQDYRAVDPNNELDPDEREKRAQFHRRARMARLARLAVQARKARPRTAGGGA